MAGIYIGSSTPRAGKSLLAFSLGLMLQRKGFSVGYMKPLGRIPQKKDELLGDADALVVQEVLGQHAPADVLTPLMTPKNLHALSIQERPGPASMERVKRAYARLSQNKDITLVSGTGAFPWAGRFAGADGFSLVRELDLKVLLIERYSDSFNHDAILLLSDMLGPALTGIVINDVPEKEFRDVTLYLVPWLKERGIGVHGIIPHEPGLQSMRVADLAYGLGGRVVAGNAQAARMVNGFLIGTMQVENFMLHLRQKTGCAVIVGGDRSDLQLAALYASTPCIILTGNITPTELIRSRAESMGVTLVVVQEDTYAAARLISHIFKSKKLRDLSQIRQATSLIENAVDLPSILEHCLPAMP